LFLFQDLKKPKNKYFFTWFSFSIMPYSIINWIPSFKRIHPCFQKSDQVQICFVFISLCIAKFKLKISPQKTKKIVKFILYFWVLFFYPIFMLKQAPRISNFSQTSSIWHVVIHSNMLTQYENNKTRSVVTMVNNRQHGHFSSKISPWFTDILPPIPTLC
jgi:hypothetical protein